MAYLKQVHYLEQFRKEEKLGTVGFVKIECLEDRCRIQICVTGLPVWMCGWYEVGVWTCSGNERAEKIVDRIELCQGKGVLQYENLRKEQIWEGVGLDDPEALVIRLDGSFLLCKWRECGEKAGACGEIQAEVHEKIHEEIYEEAHVEVHEEVHTELQAEFQAEARAEVQKAACPQTEIQKEARREVQAAEQREEKRTGGRSFPPESPVGIREQKWQQLAEIYPHLSPFRDERDYLSLSLGDFVILPRAAYRLVSNSFLLHGYYQYGHLVLAKRNRRGAEAYYLGVPGNFYEQERDVAVLFGFESFESKKEPASEGDFGYFMKQVDI